MKKTIITIATLIVMIVPFLLTPFCYAEGQTSSYPKNETYYPYNTIKDTNPDMLNQAEESGTITSKVEDPDDENTDVDQVTSAENGKSFWSAIVTLLCGFFSIIPKLTSMFMTSAVIKKIDWNQAFTIQGVVTGKYDLFDCDVFDINPTEDDEHPYADINHTLRSNVQLWYVAMRNLAIVLCAIICVYIGLRMALATVAIEQGQYKKMLIWWFTSICLLFIMHYIIYFMIYLAKALQGLISKSMDSIKNDFSEEDLVSNMFANLSKGTAGQKFATLILIWILVYLELKYFILFMTRSLYVYFLTMVGPLVMVTYPLYKMGDSNSPAFKTWTKCIANEIFLGPIEGLVYLIFVFTAGSIMTEVPFLAIILLLCMGMGERAIKKVIGLEGARGIADIGLLKSIWGRGTRPHGPGGPGGHMGAKPI